jgi:putative NADH-flavin reductase
MELVKQALELGHTVTALVRNPAKMTIKHPNLTTVHANIMETESLAAHLKGQDAVICTLGPKSLTAPLLEPAFTALVPAMQATGVSRVILMSAYTAYPGYRPSLLMRFPVRILRKTVQDKQKSEALLKKSGLEWTIIYPTRLTNGPLTGKYQILDSVPGGLRHHTSRADVADFILQELADRNSIGKSPVISS